MRRVRRRIRLAAFASLVASTAACRDLGFVDVPNVRTEYITITAPRTSLVVGDTVRITAQPRKRDGTPRDRPYAFTSSDVRLATATSTGLVTGVAPGIATITVSSDGKHARLQIVVRAAPPPLR